MLSTADSIIEDARGAQLDQEIATLQDQITSLKAHRKLQAQTILASHTTASILSTLRSHPSHQSQTLKTASSAQQNENLTTLYRACTSITTLPIHDPDPNAVDGGRVLGIRFDVSSSNGRFIRPYYIMLNRPFPAPNQDLLRMHRNTCPPCIPISALAARWLPGPSGKEVDTNVEDGMGKKGKGKQNIKRFVRDVRREVVAYHLRLQNIKNLRRQFELDDSTTNDGKRKRGKGNVKDKVIVDISAVDAEAKQVRIEWADGGIGRVVVGAKGEILNCVVLGEKGRDGANERRIMGEDMRMEGIGERLLEGIY